MKQAFLRLTFLNAAMIVLITVIPSVVYLHLFGENMNEQVNRLNEQMVTEFRNSLDDSIVKEAIRMTDLYLTERGINETLIYPFTHDITGDTSRILAVADQLKDLKNGYPFIESVDIYYRAGNLMFMGPNVCFMNLRTCDVSGRQVWLQKFTESDSHVAWMQLQIKEQTASRTWISYIRSYPFFSTAAGRQGIIAVNMDETYVREKIKALRFADKRKLWVVDPQGQVLSSNTEPGQPLPKEVADKLLSYGGEEGKFNAKIGGEPSVVSFAVSPYSKWYYVSAASLKEYNEKTVELRNGLILVGALLLLANLAVGLLIFYRAQKPIRTLFTKFSNDLDEMKERWERNRLTIRQAYISKLLHGHGENAPSDEENEQLLDIRFTAESCAAFIIRLTPGPMPLREELLLPYRLIEALEAHFVSGTLYAVPDDKRRLIGMLHFSGQDPLPLAGRMLSILQGQGEDLADFTLAVGRVYPCNPEHAAQSFREASDAMEYRFLRKDALISYDQLRLDERVEGGGSVRALNQIEEAMRSGNGDKLKLLWEEIFTEIETGRYTLSYCRNMLQDALSAMRSGLNAVGLSSVQVFGCDIRSRGAGMETLEAFREWADELIETGTAKVKEKKLSVDATLEQKLLSYIHDHIFNDISLESISEHVGMSPNYVSKLFRTMTGQTFIEYVTETKMQNAARLLMEKKHTVQEISDLLGYSSNSHFIRVFKDRFGCTPKQYQKNRPAEPD
ncbi:helix-turn-helix domain-containing protein [Paenibacillus hamazuiensis]|uniref:helix-turn-helix domain-containing protein n=1 Tax=Paenibacillus hamazuiensis TaxID=2936508 RepID=UPI0020109D68|nr:helix-turn-helix domain-containing protein [Paenibacillus hamazuiensis]